MGCALQRLVTLLLWGMLLIPLETAAKQATPTASPIAIDVGDCTVEPRTTDEMRSLIRAELPMVAALMAGTPLVGETTLEAVLVDEVEADDATIAAVEETVRQFVACGNAGHIPANAAVLTERGAGAYLTFAMLTFFQALDIGPSTVTAEVDSASLDQFLAAVQFRTPRPPEAQQTLHGIEEVNQFADGRVEVIALLATGPNEPRLTRILLRKEDGAWRIIFGPERNDGPPASPTSATPIP